MRDPLTGDIIDEALILWFPAPQSETGEDVAELQLHGGRAVIAAVLGALGRIEGLRPAEAGEFTRRAFEHGKLDLTAVEGLADLVMAETEGQRRQAFRQMKGLLGNRAETWRQRLIQALALIEARSIFPTRPMCRSNLLAPALAIARELETEIAAALADGGRGERLREGLVVAIAGPPNAGKSTLLNRIARREAAIVSPYAGTTRDVIEVHLDLARLAGDAARHRRHSRHRRSGRARGRAARARPRRRSRSGAVGGGCGRCECCKKCCSRECSKIAARRGADLIPVIPGREPKRVHARLRSTMASEPGIQSHNRSPWIPGSGHPGRL